MEDDLNFFENGRLPQFLVKKEYNLICFKWKTTSIIFLNRRRPQTNNATKNY